MFGTVVYWRPDKGYGFIRQADRPDDLFFNVSEFAGDPKVILKGTKVEFGIGAWKGKTVARDVHLLESAEVPA